jgi:hypothetical protein
MVDWGRRLRIKLWGIGLNKLDENLERGKA